MGINREIYKIDGLQFGANGYPVLTTENARLVDEYVTNQSSYSDQSGDNFVKKYFKEHIGDTSKSSIITKIILINTVDSTNLKVLLGKDYYKKMADRIIVAEIEELIAKGLPIGEKFKQIASWPPKKNSSKVDLNLFIFVSKYITRVNQYCYNRNDYSIMDSVVKNNLRLFADPNNGVEIPDLEELRRTYKYDEYCSVISNILDKHPGMTRNMLDHFIWFTFKDEAVNDK